jgi:hypothetical protein
VLASVPREFAIAFGLVEMFYIFDGFEFANVQLEPSASFFPRSLKGCNFADLLCAEVATSAYIVAFQDCLW